MGAVFRGEITRFGDPKGVKRFESIPSAQNWLHPSGSFTQDGARPRHVPLAVRSSTVRCCLSKGEGERVMSE